MVCHYEGMEKICQAARRVPPGERITPRRQILPHTRHRRSPFGLQKQVGPIGGREVRIVLVGRVAGLGPFGHAFEIHPALVIEHRVPGGQEVLALPGAAVEVVAVPARELAGLDARFDRQGGLDVAQRLIGFEIGVVAAPIQIVHHRAAEGPCHARLVQGFVELGQGFVFKEGPAVAVKMTNGVVGALGGDRPFRLGRVHPLAEPAQRLAQGGKPLQAPDVRRLVLAVVDALEGEADQYRIEVVPHGVVRTAVVGREGNSGQRAVGVGHLVVFRAEHVPGVPTEIAVPVRAADGGHGGVVAGVTHDLPQIEDLFAHVADVEDQDAVHAQIDRALEFACIDARRIARDAHGLGAVEHGDVLIDARRVCRSAYQFLQVLPHAGVAIVRMDDRRSFRESEQAGIVEGVQFAPEVTEGFGLVLSADVTDELVLGRQDFVDDLRLDLQRRIGLHVGVVHPERTVDQPSEVERPQHLLPHLSRDGLAPVGEDVVTVGGPGEGDAARPVERRGAERLRVVLGDVEAEVRGERDLRFIGEDVGARDDAGAVHAQSEFEQLVPHLHGKSVLGFFQMKADQQILVVEEESAVAKGAGLGGRRAAGNLDLIGARGDDAGEITARIGLQPARAEGVDAMDQTEFVAAGDSDPVGVHVDDVGVEGAAVGSQAQRDAGRDGGASAAALESELAPHVLAQRVGGMGYGRTAAVILNRCFSGKRACFHGV